MIRNVVQKWLQRTNGHTRLLPSVPKKMNLWPLWPLTRNQTSAVMACSCNAMKTQLLVLNDDIPGSTEKYSFWLHFAKKKFAQLTLGQLLSVNTGRNLSFCLTDMTWPTIFVIHSRYHSTWPVVHPRCFVDHAHTAHKPRQVPDVTSQAAQLSSRRDERRFRRRRGGDARPRGVVLTPGGRLQQSRPVAVCWPDVELQSLGRRTDFAAQAARGRRRGRRRSPGRQRLPRPRRTWFHAVDWAMRTGSVIPCRQRRRQPTTATSQHSTSTKSWLWKRHALFYCYGHPF